MPPNVHIEMILSKVRLLPKDPPRAGTEISLKPVRVVNDTQAAFWVPSGLQSGVYAVSLRYSATQRRSGPLYILVMQHEIGEGQFVSFAPEDRVVPEGFHGQLNGTLKHMSESSSIDLPMLDLLEEHRLPALTNLSLGCELIISEAGSCKGVAQQKSHEEFSCQIDLRNCPAAI